MRRSRKVRRNEVVVTGEIVERHGAEFVCITEDWRNAPRLGQMFDTCPGPAREFVHTMEDGQAVQVYGWPEKQVVRL
jgi:hypothetical protein